MRVCWICGEEAAILMAKNRRDDTQCCFKCSLDDSQSLFKRIKKEDKLKQVKPKPKK